MVDTMGQSFGSTMATVGLAAPTGTLFLTPPLCPTPQATEEPPATAENLRPFNLVIPFTVQKGEITGTGWGDLGVGGTDHAVGHGGAGPSPMMTPG